MSPIKHLYIHVEAFPCSSRAFDANLSVMDYEILNSQNIWRQIVSRKQFNLKYPFDIIFGIGTCKRYYRELLTVMMHIH